MAPGHRLGAARAYCFGRATSAPSTLAACQPQWGLSSMARASATMSALLSATIASARLGVAIRPTTRVAIPASRFTCSAKGTFIFAVMFVRASALTPPEEMQTKSIPASLSARANTTACFGVRPPSTQSLPVMRAPNGIPFGMAAPTACTFQWKAHARLKRATIAIAALGRDRRQEAVQQIAVRAVELDQVDTGAHRALRSRYEAFPRACHIGSRHFPRHMPTRSERNGGGSDGLPRILAGLERPGAFPRARGGGLAAGMGELNAHFGAAEAAAMGKHARERRLAIIGIEPKATMGDAAAALHAGCLDHHQCRISLRQRA